jgi:hypothetical protein
MKKSNKIHFVSNENNNAFIHGKIKTNCGKYFHDVEDFTSKKEFVNCQKCSK